jgi:DNA-binding NarL/FixJ family response regulator
MSATRALLVDDHVLVRAGLRNLLETIDGVKVIAEAGDGTEALRLASEHRPDLVIMDIAMPQLGGLDAAARIRQELPDSRVLILSMHASDEYVRRALRAGASCYLLKDAAAVELELAVRAVMRGETYLSPRVSTQVVDQFVRGPSASQGPVDSLTPRQREILQLIASGRSTKQIAHHLGLSVKTVETHRAQLMERLGLRDVASLVRLAIRAGLVASDE